jgi:hypothetical protein
VRRRGTTLSTFMYPATVFMPLSLRHRGPRRERRQPLEIAVDAETGVGDRTRMLAAFGAISLRGSAHFRTKIDSWTQRSVADARAGDGLRERAHGARRFRGRAEADLARPERGAGDARVLRQLRGQINDMAPVVVLHDQFWFDCRWQNAKYAVIAAGQDAAGLYGFDAVCTAGLPQIRTALDAIASGKGKWPIAFSTGEYQVFANPRFAGPSSR